MGGMKVIYLCAWCMWFSGGCLVGTWWVHGGDYLLLGHGSSNGKESRCFYKEWRMILVDVLIAEKLQCPFHK